MMLNSKQSHSQPETEFENAEISNILNSLAIKSQQTLEKILDDTETPPSERAEIALKILQIAKYSDKSEQIKVIDNKNIKLPLTVKNSEPAKIAQFPTNNKSTSQTESQFFPANYLQIDNFLPQEEYQKVIDTAFNKQSEFKDSRTVTNTENYRQSLILPGKEFSEVYYLVKNKLLETFPSLINQLKHPEFSVSHVEMQMTAHNDGAFYKAHTDAGSEKTKTRELTYVYYFYQEPKQFSGGELKIYDTEMQGKKIIQKENSRVIEPRNNSIVFFNSRCKHEVLPILCSSGEFKASRFTLNGWLRR
ncbi:2OG-Fe(II) oxygenase [Plectonema cf. radiosum LEGE 06105]|uniref:2OG-Fe(II) oxygenase n=1 Tax=Plectonema cf. radiosum LEGE 06105 TaxID=945769 RepID=A0A8J7JU04_9CYAN|nr:2OG-Fe(II) oxygenase [Plectonema radiosum]MBE9212890.1 2OG-Fe(II) oxygenase [Plectonema cf. radiosum LEGE 06105]